MSVRLSGGGNSWQNRYVQRTATMPQKQSYRSWQEQQTKMNAIPLRTATIISNNNYDSRPANLQRYGVEPLERSNSTFQPRRDDTASRPWVQEVRVRSATRVPEYPARSATRVLKKKKTRCPTQKCPTTKCCIFTDSMFTNGMAGAYTGCWKGGVFGKMLNKQSIKPNELPGTARRRCCVCILVMVFALLLLGLLIGLLAGLMPALQLQSAQSSISSKYANGFYSNGIYYYPVTNPPDVFYYAMGFNIPCNPGNNNSLIAGVGKVTAINCNQLTTSFVKAQGISVSTTTKGYWTTTKSSAVWYSLKLPMIVFPALISVQLCILQI